MTSDRTISACAQLYVGRVMHARLRPMRHRFTYRVFYTLLDLDRLADIDARSSIFSIGKFNLLSFYPRDHGPRDGSDLRAHADALLTQAGVGVEGGRLLLLCCPRVLGFVFNPISIYWRFEDGGALSAIIYEVRNTFGGMHSYVCPVPQGALDEAGLRQEAQKRFYVSPFLDMDLRYRFRLKPPDDELSVRILEMDGDRPVLAATLSGQRRAFTTRTLMRAFLSVPFLTLKIVAAIHWQALRLWIKGARLTSRPSPSSAVSIVDSRASDAERPIA